MSVYHDEIEIEDFDFDEDTELYTYPCPCGDRFQISKEDLASGEDTATCPSCSLIVKVIYNIEDFAEYEEDCVVATKEKQLVKN
ncbi:diphthamide biosynthesis protein 3-like isoform X3 [Scylla paramamosain]